MELSAEAPWTVARLPNGYIVKVLAEDFHRSAGLVEHRSRGRKLVLGWSVSAAQVAKPTVVCWAATREYSIHQDVFQ